MHKRVGIVLLMTMVQCIADDTKSHSVPLYAQQIWEAVQKRVATYVRCIYCHLEELKVEKTPIPGAIYYIRHRKSGYCRTYQLEKEFTEQEAHACPHHEKKEVKERLNRCYKAVTFHKADGTLLTVQSDPISGKRASIPAGPYASRLSYEKRQII